MQETPDPLVARIFKFLDEPTQVEQGRTVSGQHQENGKFTLPIDLRIKEKGEP